MQWLIGHENGKTDKSGITLAPSVGALLTAGLVCCSEACQMLSGHSWHCHWFFIGKNSIKRSMSIFGPCWPNPLPLRQDIYEVFELCTG
jgi:hypothetical protein